MASKEITDWADSFLKQVKEFSGVLSGPISEHTVALRSATILYMSLGITRVGLESRGTVLEVKAKREKLSKVIALLEERYIKLTGKFFDWRKELFGYSLPKKTEEKNCKS